MNPLIAGLVDEFASENSFDRLPKHQQFERFCAHCLLASLLADSSAIDDVVMGDEAVGLDGIAIEVNGELLFEADALDELGDVRDLQVNFSFFQAKSSQSFDRAEILNFGDSVCQFFKPSDDGGPVESALVAQRKALKDGLYQRSARFRSHRPHIALYYVATGEHNDDPNLHSAVSQLRGRLQSMGLFETVSVELVGASELHRYYNASKNRVEATFQLERKFPLPTIPGIYDSYIGVIPATEYLNNIEDEAGNLRDFIFYDNVRGFQPENPVNEGVWATLASGEAPLFPVLNNGITVVADDIRVVGDAVTLTDFQVVNGCQTSHVVHRARAHLTEEILIPIRLIRTESDDVDSQVIRATNSQTPVEESDLQALTGFQKKLEDFYRASTGRGRLYYERRDRQYADEAVERTRVIDKTTQMRAFVAMFLEEPHLASRYFNRLFERAPRDIFSDQHQLDAYYTSALTWYRLDVLLRTRRLHTSLKPGRYHILMAARYLAAGGPGSVVRDLGSRRVRRECEALNETMKDDQGSIDLLERAGSLVLEAAGDQLTRDRAKRERLTQDVERRVREEVEAE